MSILATTRFNSETWEENIVYRSRHNMEGCIYGTPRKIISKIPNQISIFVIEMNNSLNRIEGIGLILNDLRVDKYYPIHSIGDYNRYTFKGKYRMDRDDIDRKNPEVVSTLDTILFKGRTNFKRGSGIMRMPPKLLDLNKDINLHQEINKLFLDLIKNDKQRININN
jgi:hypothetical protein